MTRVFHPALSGPEQSRYQITDVASVSRSGLCINESPIRDRCGRTMGDLRLSVIDQCNLRCRYCMPEAEYAWLPRADLLSVDEISLIVDAFIAVGVDMTAPPWEGPDIALSTSSTLSGSSVSRQ